MPIRSTRDVSPWKTNDHQSIKMLQHINIWKETTIVLLDKWYKKPYNDEKKCQGISCNAVQTVIESWNKEYSFWLCQFDNRAHYTNECIHTIVSFTGRWKNEDTRLFKNIQMQGSRNLEEWGVLMRTSQACPRENGGRMRVIPTCRDRRVLFNSLFHAWPYRELNLQRILLLP